MRVPFYKILGVLVLKGCTEEVRENVGPHRIFVLIVVWTVNALDGFLGAKAKGLNSARR